MIYERDETIEIRVISYKSKPKRYMTAKELYQADNSALTTIRELEQTIEYLKNYRLELAKRCGELETMQSHVKVSFIRERRWTDSHVYYYITKTREYDDGKRQTLERETFEGKERHKAIKRFKEIKKEYPNYEYFEDIAKKRWEY